MINWLHTIIPEPNVLSFGFFEIKWYGFLIMLAIIFGYIILKKLLLMYSNISEKGALQSLEENLFDEVSYTILIAILCGRLYYVIYAWSYYQNNLSEIYQIWNGGLAIHGVIFGGLLSLYRMSKKYNISLFTLSDAFVIPVILGQAIGRWGNYFNQEIFGLPTSKPWGIPIEVAKRPIDYKQFEYFHPTFLYESLLNLSLCAVLLFVYKKNLYQRGKYQGITTYVYLMGYALIRFVMEFYRIDYSPLILHLRAAQFVSIILFIVAGVCLFFQIKKNRHSLNQR